MQRNFLQQLAHQGRFLRNQIVYVLGGCHSACLRVGRAELVMGSMPEYRDGPGTRPDESGRRDDQPGFG